MKLNDEDLESNVPEEPLPERDVLLEALVDAETEVAPRRRISKTLIAACVLSGLGVWQIVEVSNGGEPLFLLAAKAKTVPAKLRSDGRAPIGRVLPSTDPISAYLERAKRGMTDQEIRWMIEDFQTAGLDETSDPEDQKAGYDGYNERFCRIQRARQNAWYLIALGEGLDLSSDQKSMARARLDSLFERDLKILSDKWDEVRKMNGLMLGLDFEKFEQPSLWLQDEAYAPWNLCELSGQQEQLTMKKWASSAEGRPELTSDGFAQTEESKHAWINVSENWAQDPLTGNLTELSQPADPFIKRVRVSDTFSLTPDQPLSNHFGDLLAQARSVQPAQLRMALLFDADLYSTLLEKLDHPSSTPTIAEEPGSVIEKGNELPPNTVQPETPVDPLPEPDPK
ncbi:MAG: hypothetical protein CFE26_00280 [Verrucomicrobiales bacterium VVV1]|nr:MAG: hypothetical protein CFE26_00280 [Verrucomicrobiales bacterium VVV1]